jgi:hypothetical protein
VGPGESSVTVGSVEKYSVGASLLQSSTPVNRLLLTWNVSLSSTNISVLVRALWRTHSAGGWHFCAFLKCDRPNVYLKKVFIKHRKFKHAIYVQYSLCISLAAFKVINGASVLCCLTLAGPTNLHSYKKRSEVCGHKFKSSWFVVVLCFEYNCWP